MRPSARTPLPGADHEQASRVPLPLPRSSNGSTPTGSAERPDVPPGRPPAGAPRGGSASGPPARGSAEPADRELLAKRDRLIERFAAMQLDLGGIYYEMAIRDSVNDEVLVRKAADMQRVDAELRQVEGVLDQGGSGTDKCPACDALYAPGAAFCSQCGSPLAAGAAGR